MPSRRVLYDPHAPHLWPRTWKRADPRPPQSLQSVETTQAAYSGGMGVAATSSSTRRHTGARSAYERRQVGQASWRWRSISFRQSEWMVCPHGSTAVGRTESNKYSKQTGQLWRIEFSTHTWLS